MHAYMYTIFNVAYRKKNIDSLSCISATPYCLDFAYHMRGNPGDLIISAGDRNGNMQTELTLSGDQGINWLTKFVHIPQYSDVVVRMIFVVYYNGCH